jgi:hypothetical protein
VNVVAQVHELERGRHCRSQATPGAAAEAHRHLVVDQSATAARQDRWASGEAHAVLLAAVGGESPDPTPLRSDASADLGAADPDGPNRRPLVWESGKETEQGWKGVPKCRDTEAVPGNFHVCMGHDDRLRGGKTEHDERGGRNGAAGVAFVRIRDGHNGNPGQV